MPREIRIFIYHAKQCDPKKCTSLKLKRHGKARITPHMRLLPRRAIILNPFSDIAFSPADKRRIELHGLAALDCSWQHAERILKRRARGTARCLPILVAGNPVNFGKPTKLTTVEALSAALLIAGFQANALDLLSLFKWGQTFLDLNRERLREYAKAENSKEILEAQARLDRLIES